jgi:transposase
LTPIQVRDKKIKDLKIQIENLKSAEKNDPGKEAERVLQRQLARTDAENEALRKTVREQAARITELEDKISVYEARLKKDSSNSDKPQSTNPYAKPPPHSSRQRSGRRPGGQPGHRGHTMRPDTANARIVERKGGRCGCGGEILFGDEYRARRIVDLLISLQITEERAYNGVCLRCGKPFKADHSPAFSAPQKYGDGVKSLALMLNEYGNVPDRKAAEIMRALSGGAISLTDGTVNAFRASAAEAMAETHRGIKNEVIGAKVAGVDETGVRVNGKLHWMSAYVAAEHIYYEHNPRRGDHCSDPQGVLAAFTDTLVHDHFRAYYRNTVAKHGECNIHGIRHLTPVVEIHHHPWAGEMIAFLVGANNKKRELIAAGKAALTAEEYAEYESEYLSILGRGDAQYEEATANLANKKRFQEERCILKRLRDNQGEHLRYLSDFLCPFGNNEAERAMHKIKGKTRVSGGFRSDGGADGHAVIASVLMTARLQGKDILQTIRDEISKMPRKGGDANPQPHT